MKKFRILALFLAVFALVTVMALVSCDKDKGDSTGDCASGNHTWGDWKSNDDASCETDGTKTRKCTVCKEPETVTDEGSAYGSHSWYNYESNNDATCTEDGTETAKCLICGKPDTRVEEGSALGHRLSSIPTYSKNGWDVCTCTRGCGYSEVIDDGTIQEDFETSDSFEDSTKMNVSSNATVEIKKTEGDNANSYLFISRGSEKVIGNSAFSLVMTPDYSLYRNKAYVVEFDILITENTRDLDLLVGTKLATEVVFATYDYETKTIVVNGKSVYNVTTGEWLKLSFVLNDIDCVYDLYADSHLVASSVVYENKDTYYVSATISGLTIRMVAEPKVVSEYGLDNLKTYVAKAPTEVGESYVKENATTTVKVDGADITISHIKLDDECEHEFGDAITVDATCVAPGYSYKVCSKCSGEEIVEGSVSAAIVHAWSTIQDIKATCTEGGYFSQKCSACGKKERTDHDPLGHTESKEEGYEAVVTAPTCYAEGYTTRYCSVCNEHYTTDVTAKVEHTWSEGYHASDDDKPTCTEDGILTFKCTVCEEQEYTVTKTQVDPALGHTESTEEGYEATVTAPTCTEEGYTLRKCSVCGATYKTDIVEENGHSWVLVEDDDTLTYPSTCYKQGQNYYKCSVEGCDGYKTEALEKNAHTWSEEGVYASEEDKPTCTEKGKLTYTCTVEGCGATETREVEANGHTKDESIEGIVTAPTCTEGGYTTYHCTVCDQDYQDDRVGSNGHTWGDYVTTATCEKAGLKTRYCTVEGCDAAETPISDPALGHDMVVDTEKTTADCSNGGVYAMKCQREGCTHTVVDEVEALGHDWIEQSNTATCTEGGIKSSKCSRCDETKTEESEALGHVESTAEGYEAVVTAPTCTNNGYTTRHCSVCDTDYQDDIVSALGHKFVNDDGTSNWIIDKAATCYQTGERHRCCLNEGCEEVENGTIAATGNHNFDETEYVQESTDAEEGYYYHKCTTEGCPEIQKYGDPIPVKSEGTEGLEYDEVNGEYFVSGYTGTETDIVIPATYRGKAVVGIYNDAFAGNEDITSITIKGGITEIETDTFSECTSLKYVVLAASVTDVGDAFYDCTSLTDIYYAGSEDDIVFEETYEATVHYNSEGPNA